MSSRWERCTKGIIQASSRWGSGARRERRAAIGRCARQRKPIGPQRLACRWIPDCARELASRRRRSAGRLHSARLRKWSGRLRIGATCDGGDPRVESPLELRGHVLGICLRRRTCASVRGAGTDRSAGRCRRRHGLRNGGASRLWRAGDWRDWLRCAGRNEALCPRTRRLEGRDWCRKRHKQVVRASPGHDAASDLKERSLARGVRGLRCVHHVREWSARKQRDQPIGCAIEAVAHPDRPHPKVRTPLKRAHGTHQEPALGNERRQEEPRSADL